MDTEEKNQKRILEKVSQCRKWTHSVSWRPILAQRLGSYPILILCRTLLYLHTLPKPCSILLHRQTLAYLNTKVDAPSRVTGSIAYLNTWRGLRPLPSTWSLSLSLSRTTCMKFYQWYCRNCGECNAVNLQEEAETVACICRSFYVIDLKNVKDSGDGSSFFMTLNTTTLVVFTNQDIGKTRFALGNCWFFLRIKFDLLKSRQKVIQSIERLENMS